MADIAVAVAGPLEQSPPASSTSRSLEGPGREPPHRPRSATPRNPDSPFPNNDLPTEIGTTLGVSSASLPTSTAQLHVRTVSTTPFGSADNDLFVDFDDDFYGPQVTDVGLLEPLLRDSSSDVASAGAHLRIDTAASEAIDSSDLATRPYPSPPGQQHPMLPDTSTKFAVPIDVMSIDAVTRKFSGSLHPATPPQSPWTADAVLRSRSGGGFDTMLVYQQAAPLSDPMFPPSSIAFPVITDDDVSSPALFVAPSTIAGAAGRAISQHELGMATFVTNPRAGININLKTAGFNSLPLNAVALPDDRDVPRTQSLGSLAPESAATTAMGGGYQQQHYGGHGHGHGHPVDLRAPSGSVVVAPILLNLASNFDWVNQPTENVHRAAGYSPMVKPEEDADADAEGEPVSDYDESESAAAPTNNRGTKRRHQTHDDNDSDDQDLSDPSSDEQDEYSPRSRRTNSKRNSTTKRPQRNSTTKRTSYKESPPPPSKRARTSALDNRPTSGSIPPGADPSEFISPRVLNTTSQNMFSLPSSQLSEAQRQRCIDHILSKRSRNTEAARRSRERRREHLDELEGRVRELEEENERLRRRIWELEKGRY